MTTRETFDDIFDDEADDEPIHRREWNKVVTDLKKVVFSFEIECLIFRTFTVKISSNLHHKAIQ